MLPAMTYWDLAGGQVLFTLEELVPTPVMRRRAVIIGGVGCHIEDSVWAVLRMEVNWRYRV